MVVDLRHRIETWLQFKEGKFKLNHERHKECFSEYFMQEFPEVGEVDDHVCVGRIKLSKCDQLAKAH